MLFYLEPSSPMKKGSTHNTTVNVQYAHAKSPLTGLSFSYKNFGVGFEWENNCDTMADTKLVEFSR